MLLQSRKVKPAVMQYQTGPGTFVAMIVNRLYQKLTCSSLLGSTTSCCQAPRNDVALVTPGGWGRLAQAQWGALQLLWGLCLRVAALGLWVRR